MIEGKVGSKKIIWKSTPKGKTGEATVAVGVGADQKVNWIRDDQGIWIETAQGFVGYDVRKTLNDDGVAQYTLLRRKHTAVAVGAFLKAGEGDTAGTSKVKKGAKIKSQMPGKILKVLVKSGDVVKKGQPLVMMEAMKMENEIKATQDGTIKEVKVKEGQAVETGAELLNYA